MSPATLATNPASERPANVGFLAALRVLSVAMVYAAGVFYGSLVPLDYRPMPLDEAVERFLALRYLQIGVGGRADLLANGFLYIPIGFLLTVGGCRLSRSVVWKVLATLLAMTAGTVLAVATEFTQNWFPTRTMSQNDVISETIGTVLGSLLGFMASTAGLALWRRLGPRLRSIASRWGVVYIAALLIYSLMPGDLVISWEEFLSKIDKGRITLLPFTDFRLTIETLLSRTLHVMGYLPIGYLACGWRRSGHGSLWADVWCGFGRGMLFAAAAELLQLPIYSRESSTTAVCFGALGAAIGGGFYGLATRPEQRPAWFRKLLRESATPRFAWAAVIAFSLVAVAVLLQPFTLIDDAAQQQARWKSLFRVPFAALYISSEFGALTSILRKGVVFFILGSLARFAVRDPATGNCSPVVGLLCMAVIALLGAGIEVAQVYIDAYQPDATDALIYAAAAGVGFYAAGVALPRLMRATAQAA